MSRSTTRMVRNKDIEIRKQYFVWLCSLIDTDDSIADIGNRDLANWLHQKEFVAILPNDDNRASDGTKLRQDFADQWLNKEDCPCLDGPCTMLEMLVALAQRMAFQLSNGPDDNPVGKCFWEMIDNLGLKPIDMRDPHVKDTLYEMDQKLDIFMNRQYRRDGSGGLFPLRHRSSMDQRTVEIWYQMHRYIEEKNNG